MYIFTNMYTECTCVCGYIHVHDTGPHESVYVIPYIHTAFTYVFVYLREIIDGIWRELFIYASCVEEDSYNCNISS